MGPVVLVCNHTIVQKCHCNAAASEVEDDDNISARDNLEQCSTLQLLIVIETTSTPITKKTDNATLIVFNDTCKVRHDQDSYLEKVNVPFLLLLCLLHVRLLNYPPMLISLFLT